MKGEEKQNDQELLEVDDKGNYIEKKEKKKNKPSNAYKYLLLIFAFIILLGLAYYFLLNKKTNKKSVFDETKLKNLKLKSRVFLGPVFDYSFINGKFTEKGLKNYETLAKNNIALFVTEGMVIGDYCPSPLKKEVFRIDNDEYIEEFKKIADIVHKYNSYILLQMGHPGLLSNSDTIYSPSVDKGFSSNVTSKEMSKEDILRIEDYFVQAAIRAKKAGFDGIDISGQLSLVSLFFSSKYNRRNDEYGGSVEKRARFMVETIKKIREAIGDDMIISIKIDSEDENNGFTESGFLTTGKILEEAGVDMISVSAPNPIRDGELYFYERTKKLAEILKIPVVCIGGINNYENAEYVLKNSKIEYISMVRALVQDPELVTKWKQNK